MGGIGFIPVRFGIFLDIEPPLNRIIVTQAVATVFIAGICLFFSLAAAYSALLGGLVCFVPGYLAARAVVVKRDRQDILLTDTGMRPVISSVLRKWTLSVMLFIATFKLVKTLEVLFFFGVLIGLQVVYVAVPLIDANRLRRAKAGKNG